MKAYYYKYCLLADTLVYDPVNASGLYSQKFKYGSY